MRNLKLVDDKRGIGTTAIIVIIALIFLTLMFFGILSYIEAIGKAFLYFAVGLAIIVATGVLIKHLLFKKG